MKKFLGCTIGAGLLAMAAVPASAHFSEAMFQAKESTVTGTVKDFQYMNPYAWLQVEAPGRDGKPTEWSFVTESPSQLERAGIKRNAVKKGEKVTLRVRPLKDGRPGGRLLSITTADGKVLTPPMPIG